MTQVLLLGGVFIVAVAVLVGAYLFVNRQAIAQTEAALERLRETEDRQATASLRSILKDVRASDLPVFDRILTGKGVTSWLAEKMLHAGVNITPGNFLLRVVVSTLVFFSFAQLWWRHIGYGLAGAIVGYMLPWLWLNRKRRTRVDAFQEQLPEAIDMLVSSMKAGYSFQAAMKFIGEELPAPLGPEFGRFYEEQRLGMEVRTALLTLQARVASMDLKMLVTAILIQRETGGNLAEVLEKISHLMRERVTLKAEIATLTAESKLSARILSALPFVVFLTVNLVNPAFMKPLLDHRFGPWVFLAASISVGIGYWWMMKIADIEI